MIRWVFLPYTGFVGLVALYNGLLPLFAGACLISAFLVWRGWPGALKGEGDGNEG